MADAAQEATPSIGWPRAVLTAFAILVAVVVAFVYGVNAILTKVHGMPRSNRVGIATACFFIGLIALAWILRRLQRRGAI